MPDPRITRQGIEVAAKSHFARVVPIALPGTVANFLVNNWQSGVVVETSFQTDMTNAMTLAEARRSLSSRPVREQAVLISALSQSDALKLQMNLLRLAHSRLPLPLYSDFTKLSQDNANTTTFYCDTRWRRFYPGQRVIVAGTQATFGTIAKVFANRLVLTAAIGAFAAGTRIYPAVDAEIAMSNDFETLTDHVNSCSLSILEAAGKSALPATRTGLPIGFQTYQGYPILSVPTDWISAPRAAVSRAGEQFRSGRGVITYLQGDRPQLDFEVTFTQVSRQEAWDVIQFFESRRGRLLPFWFFAPHTLWEVKDTNVAYLEVAPVGNQNDVTAFLSYVGLVLKSGELIVRGIQSLTVAGNGNWRLNFDSALAAAPAVADVTRATSAHLCRFASDALKENWLTDETCSFRVGVHELLSERSATVPNL